MKISVLEERVLLPSARASLQSLQTLVMVQTSCKVKLSLLSGLVRGDTVLPLASPAASWGGLAELHSLHKSDELELP